MKVDAHEQFERRVARMVTLMFRAVIALNFLRFGLSFSRWFEGTPGSAGMCDRLLGGYRLGGFRVDFAWLIASTLIIFPATFYFLSVSNSDHRARVDVFLCAAWTIACVVYVMRGLLTGMLYFG
jgi:hypothetical protein